jgi:two-component system sensor histidine kinase KdpD
MSESSPNPARTERGALRIFLGYAAGVGKTYAMLEEAQKRKAAGVDIVIGYFEPHGRKDTIEKTQGLEAVPLRSICYRGTNFTEMDTEAILARRPQVCIVDEFAHSNVPGLARTKRWEDVRALLDAGIGVLTTMNVQHIESLNDQVWQVTGVRVRETVPDWVVEEADEIVMVDLTPRALLHRLERGVVYPPDKALRALENFFTEANLTALRDLAFRQTARQVEDHREAAAPAEGRSERILIHLTADPSAAMLIRRGRRVADYLQAECLAVYVAKDAAWSDLAVEQRGEIEKLLGFARSLHIETTILTGRDAAGTVADFARERKVTQIFIGRHSKDARRIVANAREMVITVVASRRR